MAPYSRFSTEESVTFPVPTELILTEDWRKTDSAIADTTLQWTQHHHRWAGLPIARLWPHLRLFKFFREGGDAKEIPYVKWHQDNFALRGQLSPYSDVELLMHRFEQFRTWELLLRSEGPAHPDFALDARFDRNLNAFMLFDGHHRSSFLRTSGVRYITLRTTKADRDAWHNREEVEKVQAVLKAQARVDYYTPIPHAAFYGKPALRDFSYKSRLDQILEFWGPCRIPGRLVDIGSNTGFSPVTSRVRASRLSGSIRTGTTTILPWLCLLYIDSLRGLRTSHSRTPIRTRPTVARSC